MPEVVCLGVSGRAFSLDIFSPFLLPGLGWDGVLWLSLERRMGENVTS